jgi:NADH-quinone oxidoreductase subunit J
MLDIIFYSFACLAVVSAVAVVVSGNPVHSVLFLILVFAMSAGVLMLVQAEFLAIVYIVVYVGAIAVLFLFVVMMLNVRLSELSGSGISYVPLGLIVAFVLFLELYYVVRGDLVAGEGSDDYVSWGSIVQSVSNVEVLSEVLYTYYVYYFLLAGLVLFVAMIGAIVLTLHHKADVRRQDIYRQVGRNYSSGVVKVNIERASGNDGSL